MSCSLLKGRESDGFPVYQEKFIRECIRKFPYCDVTLLQQLVRSIAPVEIVSLDKWQKMCLNRGTSENEVSQFRLCWWFSFKSKTFYRPFFFFHHCRVTTPRLCPCWLRPSQVRSASWTQSFVLPVGRREPRRDAPSVKWWAQKKMTAVIFPFKLAQCSVRASMWLESTLFLLCLVCGFLSVTRSNKVHFSGK